MEAWSWRRESGGPADCCWWSTACFPFSGPFPLPARSPSPIDPFNELPYELRALECALELAVGLLSAEVAGLEAVAFPAIEALAVAVSGGWKGLGGMLQFVSFFIV